MSTGTHNLIEVVEFCKHNGFHQAEIVGRWVWITFNEKPSETIREKLKGFGFRWIKRRGRWAHNCGHPSKRGRQDPRFKYGVIPVDNADDLKVSA